MDRPNNKLGFGCMRLPMLSKRTIDMELFRSMVDTAMAEGCNYFDTAYRYCRGKSEPALKEVLIDRYPRESFILTTKLTNEFMKTREEQEEIFTKQLINLGQENGYFDYYLIHNQSIVNYGVSKELDSFGFARKKKDEGYIKHIGISFHDRADLLEQILIEQPDVEVVQLQINYLDWENESIQSRRCYEIARKYGKDVFVMEPLKGGTLTRISDQAREAFEDIHPEWTAARWGLAFAASLEGVKYVLSGVNSMEMLTENMKTLGSDFRPLNQDEIKTVMRVAEITDKEISIPCTGCHYCTQDCPKNIPIPEYLHLIQDKHNTTQIVYYFNYVEENYGRASDCIKCGVCEKHCPQHLPIRDYMSNISKSFDFFKGWR